MEQNKEDQIGELERLRARVAALEQTLHHRDEQLAHLSDVTPDVITEYDSDLRHIFLNRAGMRPMGIPAEQYIGRTVEEMGLAPDHAAIWNDQLRQAFASGEQHNFEFSYETPAGLRHFHTVFMPTFASDGGVKSVFALTRDITDRKEAEIALLENETKYRTLFNSLADIVIVVDAESWQVLDVNGAACQALGYSREEMLTLNVRDISAEVEKTRVAMEKKQFFTPLRYYRKKDGTVFPVELRNSEFHLRGKRYLIGAAHDISERLERQARLHAERDLLNQIMTTSPTCIIVADREGQITFANPLAEQMLRLHKNEQQIYERPTWVTMTYDGRPISDEERLFSQIKILQIPLHGAHYAAAWPDGRRLFLLINGAPLFDAQQEFDGVVFSVVDVTAQVETEQTRDWEATVDRALAALYQPLITPGLNVREVADVVLFYAQQLTGSEYGYVSQIDPATKGNIVHTFGSMALLDFDEFLPLTFMASPDGQYPGLWGHALNTHQGFFTNDPTAHPTSLGLPATHMPIDRFLSVPILIGDELVGQIALANPGRDYTVRDLAGIERIGEFYALAIQRTQAEQALMASEKQYRQLFEELSTGFALHRIVCDDAGTPIDYVFLQVNPAFERLTGLVAKDILGRSAREVLPQIEPYWIEQYGQVALTGRASQFSNYSAAIGKHYEVRAFSPQPGQFATIFNDITERKRDEMKLLHYAQRLQVLHEIDLAILSATSVEEIASVSLRYLHQLIPTMRASVTIFDFEQGQHEVLAVHADGETILHSAKAAPPSPAWLERLQPGKPVIVPDILALPWQSPTLTTLIEEGVRSLVNVPLLAYGKLIGVLNLVSNELQEFENERVEIAAEVASQIAIAIQQVRLFNQVQRHANELEQRVTERTTALQTANQRLRAFAKAKDDFVSNVSHELRNPITSLKLREHLLVKHPENIMQHMEVIQRDTMRLERLIEDLLLLSRLDRGRQVSKLEPVDINELTAHYLSDRLSLAQARDLTLVLHPSPDLPLVEADFGLVEQVLGILLTNAINYTPREGQITVSTRLHTNGDQVGISVADTGLGIPPEELSSLFDRFFRGKVGRQSGASGTGLGLSIAKEIADLHHGSIEVDSPPGQGATFSIWLPITAPTTEEATPQSVLE